MMVDCYETTTTKKIWRAKVEQSRQVPERIYYKRFGTASKLQKKNLKKVRGAVENKARQARRRDEKRQQLGF
jgi:hypothetical protein